MKVVILAGGFGTRLSEHTKSIPKPMVKIGDKPILVHIMKLYAKYGFKEFIIALGYKGNFIKKYFKKKKFNWNIKLVDTGLNTMTGGRLKRLKNIIGNQRFLMTYGDGISNINLKKLLRFHIKNNKLVTLSAGRPPARFGAIKLNGNSFDKVFSITNKNVKYVKKFSEPYLIELKTFRNIEHCGPNEDDDLNYRNKNYLNIWKKRCPIRLYENYLDKRDLMTLKKKFLIKYEYTN